MLLDWRKHVQTLLCFLFIYFQFKGLFKVLLRLSTLTYYNFVFLLFSAFITCVICCICQCWKLCTMYTFEIKFDLFCSVLFCARFQNIKLNHPFNAGIMYYTTWLILIRYDESDRFVSTFSLDMAYNTNYMYLVLFGVIVS